MKRIAWLLLASGLALTLQACAEGPHTDKDADNVLAIFDNCPNTYNPDQLDTDEDGIGDACEGDLVDASANTSEEEEVVVEPPEEDSGAEAEVDAFSDPVIEEPSVSNKYEVAVTEEPTVECDFLPPKGGGASVLRGSESGFVLELFSPLGLSIASDGSGGLTANYRPPPQGFNETQPRQVEVIDIVREGKKVILTIMESRFTEDQPEGCTRTYTLVYDFLDETVFDFISMVPAGGAGDVSVESPSLEGGQGFLILQGQIVPVDAAQVYHVWTEVSGEETNYNLTRIHPDPEGFFEAMINIDLPANSWVTVQVLADGRIVISTSGEAPSE